MKDKSIRDAIASLRADLDKLEARVKEGEKPKTKHEIAAERLYWALAGVLFDSKESYEKEVMEVLKSVYGEEETKVSRYNWPEIIKQYPEAQWASTDKSGRVDYWDRRPIIWEDCIWGMAGRGPIGSARERYTHTQDWADSLEKRPDYL